MFEIFKFTFIVCNCVMVLLICDKNIASGSGELPIRTQESQLEIYGVQQEQVAVPKMDVISTRDK